MSEERCERFRELVSAFVDESLDAAELLRTEAHLEQCAACRAFESEVRRGKQLLVAGEAFRPLRRPPPGFAARVALLALEQQAARTIAFPAGRASSRPAARSRLAFAAAAAAAVLFFGWSWQRVLNVDSLEPRVAVRAAAPGVVVAASLGEGDMETWLHEHATGARDGTLLGPAEEVEFASFPAVAGSGR
jgi:anti-sigma factor RsiW